MGADFWAATNIEGPNGDYPSLYLTLGVFSKGQHW